VIHGRESFAIEGVVLDLDPEPMLDQLAKLAMLGGVIRIDAEQELLIVSVKNNLPTQGSCVRPDGQLAAKLINA